MIKRFVIFSFILSLLYFPAFGETLKRRALISYTIEKYTDQGEQVCQAFVLTLFDIKSYIEAMKTAPNQYFTHQLHSPCQVHGTITFAGGDVGTFVIHSSGIGSISTSQRGVRIVFSQPKWNDPWAGGYGLDG